MFDETKIVLNLAVLSDMHVGGIWHMDERVEQFHQIVKLYKRLTDNKLDAFLLNGDFTNAMSSPANVVFGKYDQPDTYEEAKALQNANEFATIRRALAAIDEDIDILYTLGNHDGAENNERFITEFSSRDTIGDNKNFARMYRTDLDLDALHQGARHCVVGGYHVVCLNLFLQAESEKRLALIKQWLDEITANEPEKYVFVMFHYKVPDTVMFSNYSHGINAALGELLKQYPQVVLLTGHTHSPLQNERSIWQGDYTAIETSSINYLVNCSLEITECNVSYAEKKTEQQGLLIQADEAGNLRILKLSLPKEQTIGEPWLLSKPTADGSHLKAYTNERAHRYPAPQFPRDAVLSVNPHEEQTAVTFPAAQHDDMVYRYEAVVTNKLGNSEVFYVSSLFCYDNPDTQTVRAVLPCNFESVCRISVTPQDVWFNCGEALHFNKN